MTTNTKTITAAEKAVQEAQNTLQERRKALQGIEASIESIRRSWEGGDDSIPASKMTELRAEIERLSPLVSAAERQVKAAERKVKSLSPILAESVAAALGDFIFSTPAKVATTRPVKGTEKVEVHVIETRPYELVDDYSGAIKGHFDIIVTGPAFLRPFDATAVQAHLKRNGVNTGYGNAVRSVTEVAPGIFAASFHTENAMPLMPVIPKVLDNWITNVLDKNHVEQLQAMTYSPSLEQHMLYGVAKAEKVSEHVGKDGTRKVVLDASMSVRVGRPGVTLEQVAKVVETYLSEKFTNGRGIRAVGVIESIEFSRSTASFEVRGRNVPGAKVTARLVLVSKVAE